MATTRRIDLTAFKTRGGDAFRQGRTNPTTALRQGLEATRDELKVVAEAIADCDKTVHELRRELTVGPAPIPCNAYINQLDKEVA